MSRSVRRLMYAVLILLPICAALLLTGIGCPIRWVTGIPCPGCGMTRASVSLLIGDSWLVRTSDAAPSFGTGIPAHLRAAWYYHPLVFVIIPAILYGFLGKRPLLGSAKREQTFLLAGCTLMIAVYMIRLLLHDPVLRIDWDAGLIARILNHLSG